MTGFDIFIETQRMLHRNMKCIEKECIQVPVDSLQKNQINIKKFKQTCLKNRKKRQAKKR